MLSWRRKSDGFDWHKHVRTTVRLRRANRRQAIEGAKVAAVGRMKDAGKASMAAGSLALSAAGRWAGSTAMATLDGISRLAAALPPAASRAWGRGQEALRPLCGPLKRHGVQPLLVLIAIFSAMVLVSRFRFEGIAIGTGLAAAVFLIAGGWAALPVLLGEQKPTIGGSELVSWARRRMASLPLPAAARASRGVRFALVATAAVLLAGGVFTAGWFLWKGTVQLATMMGIPGLTARTVEGRAVAMSGDTLRVGDTIIRLAGIEAPLREQRCTRPGSRRWRCGEAAFEALARGVRGAQVTCTVSGVDENGRSLGTCRARNRDLAEGLVREGHVFATTGLFAQYSSQEKEARAEKLGLWRGEAERPSQLRAKDGIQRTRDWEEARRAAPNGCPVKGQVVSGKRYYVLPGSPDYDRIRIRARRGERWFCSEQEAAAAGWKPSPRS